MTTWQTGGLDGEVAGLDGERSSKVADLDGVVAARMETMWQIWTYSVVSREMQFATIIYLFLNIVRVV